MELVKQISVFVENASGKLSSITAILGKAGINIRALSIADTTDFGILRMIVPNPDEAVEILAAQDIMVKSTQVIAVEIDDSPNGLHSALALLSSSNVALEYLYAFSTKHQDKAYVIMKTDDAEAAVKALTEGGLHVLSAKEVYEL